MEHRVCSTRDCKSRAEISCAGRQQTQYFCLIHFTVHSSEYEIHQIIDLEYGSPQLVMNAYEIIEKGQEREDEFQIFQANRGIFLMAIKNISIRMPNDYMTSLNNITGVFIDKICLMPNGKSEKLEKKCTRFTEALNKLIYNLDIDHKHIVPLIGEIYGKLHSKIADQVYTGLLHLVDTAQNVLKMPEKVKKNLIFTVKLSDQKSRFIEKILMTADYSIDTVKAEFYEHFSKFFKESDQNIYDQLKYFDETLQNEKAKLINAAKQEFFEYVESTLIRGFYLRSGVFTIKFSPDSIRSCLNSDWVMLLSMILKEDSPQVHSIIEISAFEIIICVVVKIKTFLIYHAWNNSNILMVLPSVDFVVASGSVPSSILVAQNYPKSIDEYAIVSNKLKKKRRFEFNLETFEKIDYLALAKDQDKAFFSTDVGNINMNSLSSPARTRIPIDLGGEKCVGLSYIPQKGVVCLKTPNFLRIFTGSLDILHRIAVRGTSLTYICSESVCSFYILDSHRVYNFDVNLPGTQSEESQSKVPAKFIDFSSCSNSMSQDFVFSRSAKPDPYLVYINKRFSIPDYQPNFDTLLIGQAPAALVPSPVTFLPCRRNEVARTGVQGEGRVEERKVESIERPEAGDDGTSSSSSEPDMNPSNRGVSSSVPVLPQDLSRSQQAKPGGQAFPNPSIPKQPFPSAVNKPGDLQLPPKLSPLPNPNTSAVPAPLNKSSSVPVPLSNLPMPSGTHNSIPSFPLPPSNLPAPTPNILPNSHMGNLPIPNLSGLPNPSNLPMPKPGGAPSPNPNLSTINLPTPNLSGFPRSSNLPMPNAGGLPSPNPTAGNFMNISPMLPTPPGSFPGLPNLNKILPLPVPSNNMPMPFSAFEKQPVLPMPPSIIPIPDHSLNQVFTESASDESDDSDEN